ncbi:hypothetical protein K5D45_00520 [Pseudomonas cichorii]|nr:hypothetical protein [Pseudomonas cichorii]MBX8523141.1 hypothetical protein [Pseudomonas cichorii]
MSDVHLEQLALAIGFQLSPQDVAPEHINSPPPRQAASGIFIGLVITGKTRQRQNREQRIALNAFFLSGAQGIGEQGDVQHAAIGARDLQSQPRTLIIEVLGMLAGALINGLVVERFHGCSSGPSRITWLP